MSESLRHAQSLVDDFKTKNITLTELWNLLDAITERPKFRDDEYSPFDEDLFCGALFKRHNSVA